jgi:hypothetical protein
MDSIDPDQPGTTSTWEDRLTATPAHLPDVPEVSVVVMDAAEWREAARRALARLNLTYAQLADQAKRRDFSSTEARKLWVAIGDSDA